MQATDGGNVAKALADWRLRNFANASCWINEKCAFRGYDAFVSVYPTDRHD